MTLPKIELIHRGRWHSVDNVPPARTLLDLLREDLRATDTKEGCASGDCGACTVVLGQGEHAHTVNSCIRMAHSAHGLQVTTASDLSANGELHPVQQAMVDHHGSQCGFCTPGFVMSLYDLYNRAQGQAVTREQAMEAISGNLCRCTGYRPILEAFTTFCDDATKDVDKNTSSTFDRSSFKEYCPEKDDPGLASHKNYHLYTMLMKKEIPMFF
jgi:xanthine dehydrogenase small subunit